MQLELDLGSSPLDVPVRRRGRQEGHLTMDLKGRVAVVTGAGSGLGRAAALALAEQGARVAVLDKVAARVEAVAAEDSGMFVPVVADVADEASLDSAFDVIDDQLGCVHVCVNAAGIPDSGKIVADGKALDLGLFTRVLGVNLIGVFDTMRRCAERMVANDPDPDGERGVVVNVSSGAAWMGTRGQAAYAASKAGLIGLMLPTARDLSDDGIRVVTIAPGLFHTGMIEEVSPKAIDRLTSTVLNPKRMGDPAEFAKLVVHVVANGYLNATTIAIDAGLRTA